MKIRFVFPALCIAILALSGLTACGSSHSDDSTVLMAGYGIPPTPYIVLVPGKPITFAEIATAYKNMLHDNGIDAAIHGCVDIFYPGSQLVDPIQLSFGVGNVLINVPSADVKAAEALGLQTFVKNETAKYTYFDCNDTIPSTPYGTTMTTAVD